VIQLGAIPISVPESVTEARNKVRTVVETVSEDAVIATRLATATSAISRILVGEGESRIEIRLEPKVDRFVVCLDIVTSRPVDAVNQFSVFFDSIERVPQLDSGHRLRAGCILPLAIKLTDQKVEYLKSIVRQKGRDALMAEVQARNIELKDSLENLRRTRSAKERMESELNIGRDIQMSMVPVKFPPFPDRTEFTIYATLQPAREVGGDFYDFFLIDENHLCFAVGDVSGKGVASALFMAVTKTLIKSLARNDKSPASIMTGVNDELSDNNDSCMFVTIWLAVLNVRTGELTSTNAGHNPPYLRRADDSIERLANRHGPIVGARGGIAYREDKIQLARGDLLLLYTDGVTEATSIADELYTEERLKAVLQGKDCTTVENTVNTTVLSVKQFEDGADQYDDITVMAVRFMGVDDNEKDEVLKLVIKNALAEIETVSTRFSQFAEEYGLPKSIRQKTQVALDELLNNTISYAYDAVGEHTIEITVALTAQRLVITLVDSGQPFNPFAQKEPDTKKSIADRDIGGLGIQIVRKIMDDVSYERRINRNVVKLVKHL
jgi:sigma-B regulation protein RsbU (phosphoserine phosphatase)